MSKIKKIKLRKVAQVIIDKNLLFMHQEWALVIRLRFSNLYAKYMHIIVIGKDQMLCWF